MSLKTIIIALLVISNQLIHAQSLEELYTTRNYSSLIKYAENSEELSGQELYFVGYAFFQMEDDINAIKMYDYAIKKGLDDDYIHLYKGLSLRYSGKSEQAIESLKLAVERNPKGQVNHTELGNSYYFIEEFDTALIHFQKARELPYEHGDPYIRLPNIYHIQENFEMALKEYKKSANLINKEDPIYIELLKEIGLLEYTVFKNYETSISAYEKVLEQNSIDYNFYPKLIKAYYANEEFEKGDSLINILKVEYENGNLPEELAKYGNIPIAEFEWNKQKVSVYKYLNEPKETLDLMYKIYIISKDGKSVERTLITEKTFQIGEDGVKHLLCERDDSGAHHTYPFGWSTDKIEFKSLQKAVLAVLNEELTPSASSNFSQPNTEKKSKNGNR